VRDRSAVKGMAAVAVREAVLFRNERRSMYSSSSGSSAARGGSVRGRRVIPVTPR
jgi:hypothetical protein